MDDFEVAINTRKTMTKGHWSGYLLEELNLRLFGFLGDPDAPSHGGPTPFPHHHFLETSKTCFWADLRDMTRVVRKWRIGGGRVMVNNDLSFQIGGESEAFFKTLDFMGELQESRPAYFRDWARGTFGVYPGEAHGSHYAASWEPEATAVLIRRSLEAENTVMRVARSILDIKRQHSLKFLPTNNIHSIDGAPGTLAVSTQSTAGAWSDTSFHPLAVQRKATRRTPFRHAPPDDGFIMLADRHDEFATIEGLDIDSLRSLRYTDWSLAHGVDGQRQSRSISTIRALEMELQVDAVARAEAYLGTVPPEILARLEVFLTDTAHCLAEAIPFRLTPELYILSGPVCIRTRIIKVVSDPLIILRFAEFPALLIPVAYWLPISQGHEWQPGQTGVKIARAG
jgi:hypothetical protein